MARIPEADLDRIKRDTDLEALVRASGVQLTRQGEDLVGLCPFHEDHEPSLVVSPHKSPALWHCLGACGAGGTVIDWVMRAEGLSFRHAAERLRERLGLAAVPSQESSWVLDPGASDGELLRQYVAYCHAVAGKSEEAQAYLAKRGLASPELVAHFALGFADRTLGYRLPAATTKTGQKLRERLEQLGILRASGHEHLNGRLIVPVFDAAGEVAQLYGRVVRTNLRKGTPDHLYLPGPLRGVFNLPGLATSREVILCEALLDALTFWAAGFRNVTTTFGVHGPTDELLEAFLGHGIERVLIAFDADEAGETGARAVAERLGAVGIDCWRVAFPHGLDANAYALKVQPPAKALDLVLRHATWMGEGAAPLRLGESELVVAASSAAGEPVPAPVELARSPEAFSLAADPLAGAAPAAPAALASAFASPSSLPALAPHSAASSSLLPARPPLAVPCERVGEDVLVTLGDRRFRVRGLAKNLSFDALKVNVLVSRGEAFHVDTLDLCSSRHRGAFAKQGAVELGMKEETLLHDLGRVYLKLEELQEAAIKEAQTPKDSTPTMTADEREAALALLRDPRLLERIVSDLERVGLVGEAVNKLVCYLVAISRKLPKPLGALIQSSTAAGKSSLMRAVLELVPEEDRVAYSAMTGQSLFYMAEKDLRHKLLAIAEEEGAEKASYALKLLMSEGELSIASTGKDPQSGRLVTHEYHVEGPIAVLSTTTSIDVDEELLNRCLVLTVDEDREQTRAIHRAQRASETLEGQLASSERPALRTLHQNAQRLLEPLLVGNPFAESLTYPDATSRLRRDHEKYLRLIRTVALLHQHQRERKTTEVRGKEVAYIEVTAWDVGVANQLARLVLARSLDELPPQTRRLLYALDVLVRVKAQELGIARSEVRFSRREVRAFTGLGHSQLAIHLSRLESLEYVLTHRSGKSHQLVYELAYEAQGGQGAVVLAGLLDVGGIEGSSLPSFLEEKPVTTASLPGSDSSFPEGEVSFPGRFRPASGAVPGGFRGEQTPAMPGVLRRFEGRASRNRTYGSQRRTRRRSDDQS
jgi:DNA primase catalytic core